MRIEVDREGCVGGGQCVIAAPDVFDQRDDDGTVILLNAQPPPELHDGVRRAAMLCPANVIRLLD
jgi:ferredoxin